MVKRLRDRRFTDWTLAGPDGILYAYFKILLSFLCVREPYKELEVWTGKTTEALCSPDTWTAYTVLGVYIC